MTIYFLSVRFLSTIVLVTRFSVLLGADDVLFPCTTPDEESAYCISLFKCPGLMKSMATLEHTAIKYLKQSICLGCKAGDFMVCCGKANLNVPTEKLGVDPPVSITPPITVTTPKSESKRDQALRTLIPDSRYCGLQHTDDRYYNDSVTALDEFPWLVHIKFTDIYSDYKLGDRCTGVLLNPRYVLTDTVCAEPALKVRLGQYDAAHKVTCVQNPQAHECNEGTIEIRIEKKINLQKKSVFPNYELTLIRLASPAEYSDFVRPICLPLVERHRASSKDSLIFSGWGAKPMSHVIEDAIKKRLVYDTTKMEECAKSNSYLQTIISESSLSLHCFSPRESNTDSACDGDHGGPLMYMDSKHQWFIEHVVVTVSSTYPRCSKTTTVVAVKITPDIIDAILENMEE